MADLDPAAIESLLNEGALRRGVPVDPYRNLVQATADKSRGGHVRGGAAGSRRFRQDASARAQALEQVAILEGGGSPLGVSVSRSVKIMLCGDHRKSPVRH